MNQKRIALRLASMRPRFANRGSLTRIRSVSASSDASMRPRFANRGSGKRCAQRDRLRALQGGPDSRIGEVERSRRIAPIYGGFNEAPIRESGKSDRAVAAGRGPRKASMRPRFANRGSGRPPAGRQSRIRASMRPRFANRGSQAWRRILGGASNELQ